MKAIVIGSGIAGIASSIRLRSLGYEVEVFEANAYTGGKLTEIEQKGYRFDAGPSLFTLPQLVEELFEAAGKPISDYFSYKRLEVITEYFFESGLQVKAFAEPERFAQELEAKTGERAQHVIDFLNKSKELYRITENVFLKKSLHQLSTYLNKETLWAMTQLHKLNAFRSMNVANEHVFKHPEVVQLFNRYATYNGSNPYQCPATMNIIPHLEFGLGAYYPKGGMHQISQSLTRLAKDLGVTFHLSAPVEKIETQNKKAVGVWVKGDFQPADTIVCNMDIRGAYGQLLRHERQPETLLKQPKSSSALIFYWGIKKAFPPLDLHNIFFSTNYQEEFSAIFDKKSVYHDPTVYVNVTSKESPSDAPHGSENWFTMINVPNNSGQNWDSIIAHSRQDIVSKMSRMLSVDLESMIEVEDVLEPRTIESRTSSAQGALYGNSSNNPYAAFLRHPNFSPRIKELYFCGGSVHPGGGIPLALLSARIVGDLVKKRSMKSAKNL